MPVARLLQILRRVKEELRSLGDLNYGCRVKLRPPPFRRSISINCAKR